MDELVTIGRFATAVEANVARARLEVEGIDAHVAGEFSILSGLSGTATIELQVAGRDAELASGILGERAPRREIKAWGVEEPAERCMVCQSSFVEAEAPALPLRVLRALLLQVVPLPAEWLASRRRVCQLCGHEWTTGDEQPPPPVT